MGIFRKILQIISDELPCRSIVGDKGEPYLNRYYVVSFGPDANPWFALYLHKFKASDPDCGYHDHPWDWAWSLVLSGRYVESKPGGYRLRRPFSLGRLTGDTLHRVVLDEGAECWTLFCHGRRTKGWGFFRFAPFGDLNTEPKRTVIVCHRLGWPYTYEPMASASTDSPAAGWWHTAPDGKYVD